MWCFKKSAACSMPEKFAFWKFLSRLNVNLAHLDTTSAVCVISVAYKITFVILKIKWWVDAVLVYDNRFRPLSVNIIGIYIKILVIAVISRNHVKSAVIVSDCRGKDTAWTADTVKVYLWSSCETVTYLFPVYHVSAFKKWNTGENVHWTANHVVFSVCGTDTWIRIKTSYYWI